MQFLMRRLPGRKTRLLPLAAAFFLALMPAAAAKADSPGLNEQKVKAGLIYNFLKYTDWHARAGGSKTLQVCLYGHDPLNEYLLPLQGHTAQQYPIEVVSLDSLDRATACNLIFVSRAQEDNLDALLGAVRGAGILTVSDISRFSRRGGMIELSVQDDQRIHLYVNKAALSAAGLTLQGRILNLAEEPGQK